MSNRNDNNFKKNKNIHKHIKNTDNEETRYIPVNSDKVSTLDTNKKDYPDYHYQRQNSVHDNAPRFTTGRQQYYNSENYITGSQPYRQQRPPQQQYGQQHPPQQQYGQQRHPQQQYAQQRPPQQQYAQQRPTRQQYGQQRPPQQQYAQQRPPQQQYAQQRPPQQQYAQQRPPQQQHGQQRPPQQQHGQQRPPQHKKTNRKDIQPKNIPIQQQAPKTKENKKRRKKSILSKLLISILTTVTIIFIVYSAISLFMINKLNFNESNNRNHVAGALEKSHVTNILLIGTDGRTISETGRSDTMILLSLNSKTNEIVFTSFMRDTYVNIPGYGMNKLNAAYSYGGADLLMDTIEQNFMIRIDNYISVNFMSFATIIDSVGGIEINVSDAEAREINTILMAEVNEIMGDAVNDDLLDKGGKLILNGKQALSFARIRYIGNADFERTERQREVLSLLAKKLKSFNPSIIGNVASKAIPELTTNMSKGELYLLSLRLPFIIRYKTAQVRIPAEGTYNGASHDCGDVLETDFNKNYNILLNDVFGG